jgi:hypothetical protein
MENHLWVSLYSFFSLLNFLLFFNFQFLHGLLIKLFYVVYLFLNLFITMLENLGRW